ncbi:MAG TPA: hypothetical protein VM509_00815 [Planctomycetota bacterium]|nr:hypothetical protein [Planctomycetota bacterium]
MAKNRKIASTKSVKTETTSDVEVVVEVKKGMGWEGGVAVITCLILIAACLCVDYDLGHKFNQGMFFKQ